jgi:signal transduction histidine kinase
MLLLVLASRIALADTAKLSAPVDIDTTRQGAQRDTGVGFASDLERMFEHFTTTKPNGLGLGLAISRSIVQAHGGRLWASRNAGRGLTMHVELPYSEGGQKP